MKKCKKVQETPHFLMKSVTFCDKEHTKRLNVHKNDTQYNKDLESQ